MTVEQRKLCANCGHAIHFNPLLKMWLHSVGGFVCKFNGENGVCFCDEAMQEAEMREFEKPPKPCKGDDSDKTIKM